MWPLSHLRYSEFTFTDMRYSWFEKMEYCFVNKIICLSLQPLSEVGVSFA